MTEKQDVLSSEALFRKFALNQMSHLFECCAAAVDLEAIRADQAELRLGSVRETLAAVRAQHEAIFARYEELKGFMGSTALVIPNNVESTNKFYPGPQQLIAPQQNTGRVLEQQESMRSDRAFYKGRVYATPGYHQSAPPVYNSENTPYNVARSAGWNAEKPQTTFPSASPLNISSFSQNSDMSIVKRMRAQLEENGRARAAATPRRIPKVVKNFY